MFYIGVGLLLVAGYSAYQFWDYTKNPPANPRQPGKQLIIHQKRFKNERID